MVKIKFVGLFEMNNFTSKHVFISRIVQFLIVREFNKFQSNRLILSKVIEYAQTDTLTDRQTLSHKQFFFNSGGLKTWRFLGHKELLKRIQVMEKMRNPIEINLTLFSIKVANFRQVQH